MSEHDNRDQPREANPSGERYEPPTIEPLGTAAEARADLGIISGLR